MAPSKMIMALFMVLVTMLWARNMAQSDCTSLLVTMAPCLNYVTGSSTTPSASCCSQLANVVQSQPRCLCMALKGGSSSLGVPINQAPALSLPAKCNVKTPPVSKCNAADGPATAISPSDSPAGSPQGPPLSGSGGATAGSPNAASTTFIFYKFSLQWLSAACSSNLKCRGLIPPEFTIHGLWPQDANDNGIPPYNSKDPIPCTTATPVDESDLLTFLRMNNFDRNVLSRAWPNLKNSGNITDNRGFWVEEWKRHGKCSDYADQPVDYFQIAVNLKNGFHKVLQLKRGKTYKVKEVVSIVGGQIQNKRAEINCNRDRNTKQLLLVEVRICYVKAMPPMEPQDCQKAYSGACNSINDNILFI